MNIPKSNQGGRSSRGSLLALVIVFLIVVAGVYFARTRGLSLGNAFHSVKESSQDAATTSKVRTALLLSKHVSPYNIKVETHQGEVTLNGQVPSEETKGMAAAIAQDTSGVRQVHNNLAVNPAAERNPEMERLGERVADLEIKTIISDALFKNADLKDKHIDVQVKNRVVSLNGTVDSTTQKYAAEQIAWQVPAVQGVSDYLTLGNAQPVPEGANEKLARRVEFELYSTRAISLKTVQIRADNGVVTLSGSVASRAEKLLAEKTAQSVEGVRKVVNNLAAPETLEL